MLSFWFLTKLSHLLPLDVMLTKSVNIKSSANRHGTIPCFCSISLCSNYQFDLFVHADPYSPLNYPRIMFQEPPDTRRKTIADVLWNNCWPDGQNDDCGSKVGLLLKDPLHSWGLWPEPLSSGAAGTGQPAGPRSSQRARGQPSPAEPVQLTASLVWAAAYLPKEPGFSVGSRWARSDPLRPCSAPASAHDWTGTNPDISLPKPRSEPVSSRKNRCSKYDGLHHRPCAKGLALILTEKDVILKSPPCMLSPMPEIVHNDLHSSGKHPFCRSGLETLNDIPIRFPFKSK